MNDGQFVYIKIGDLYVKEFKLTTNMVDQGYWKVRKEVFLTNDIREVIPIDSNDARELMTFLDKNAVLISSNLTSKSVNIAEVSI